MEINKRSDDESISAWASDQHFAGMLASSPSYFAASEDVRKYLRGVEQQRVGVPHPRSTIARR